jgi:hypothetical protein
MGPNGPTESQIFLAATDGGTGLVQGTWSVRPVSLRVDHAGLLAFSNDGNGTVNKIGYKP